MNGHWIGSREQLIPLGTRPPYYYKRIRMRRVANDALVAVGAMYSVATEYVSALVSVQERAERCEFLHAGKLLARHQKATRHSLVMEPAHYAGLLRVSGEAALPPAPCGGSHAPGMTK